jgi:hypothetical protein
MNRSGRAEFALINAFESTTLQLTLDFAAAITVGTDALKVLPRKDGKA